MSPKKTNATVTKYGRSKVFSRTLKQLLGANHVEIVVPEPKTEWWDRFVPGTTLRTFEVAVAAAGVGATVVAVVALYKTQEQTTLAQAALLDQRISSAWQILAIPGGGTTGKTYALGTLVSLGEPVTGLDLSCPVELVPRPDYVVAYGCPDEVVLTGLKLIGPEGAATYSTLSSIDFSFSRMENIELRRVWLGWDSSLTGVYMSNATIDDVSIQGVDFSGSYFSSVSVTNSHVDGTFDRVSGGIWFHKTTGTPTFRETDLVGFKLSNNDFQSVDISGATLCRTRVRLSSQGETDVVCALIDQAFMDVAYFDPQRPPTGIEMLPPEINYRLPCPGASDGLFPVCDTGLAPVGSFPVAKQE